MRENTVIKMSVQRMVCTGCGSEANATCDCGVSYVPKAVRAREMKKADPERSNSDIARELGTDASNVRKALSKGVVHTTPKLRVIDDGDEFNERIAYSQTKDAFMARAAEAEADAMYVGKVDIEVILAAEETAAAWCQLVSKLKGEM